LNRLAGLSLSNSGFKAARTSSMLYTTGGFGAGTGAGDALEGSLEGPAAAIATGAFLSFGALAGLTVIGGDFGRLVAPAGGASASGDEITRIASLASLPGFDVEAG
jgi:hypothetical protein